MQIQGPIVSMIANKTWCINEYGMDAMFLLEGGHKALLIDTGTGTFDIAALCRKLTDKPLMVACTHGHVDHVGGIGYFDEVWLHPDDFEMARTLTPEARKGYVKVLAGMSGGLFAVTEEDVKAFAEAGADVILMPAPGTVPGITTEYIRKLVSCAHGLGRLTLTAVGTSQEGADTATIREIALMCKMTGTDLHHLGDSGYVGMALPENILEYSKVIRGVRHTYHRMASSINR